MQETWVQSLGWENPLEKGMATHSRILTWGILHIEEPGRLGLQSMGSQKSQTELSDFLSLSLEKDVYCAVRMEEQTRDRGKLCLRKTGLLFSDDWESTLEMGGSQARFLGVWPVQSSKAPCSEDPLLGLMFYLLCLALNKRLWVFTVHLSLQIVRQFLWGRSCKLWVVYHILSISNSLRSHAFFLSRYMLLWTPGHWENVTLITYLCLFLHISLKAPAYT